MTRGFHACECAAPRCRHAMNGMQQWCSGLNAHVCPITKESLLVLIGAPPDTRCLTLLTDPASFPASELHDFTDQRALLSLFYVRLALQIHRAASLPIHCAAPPKLPERVHYAAALPS